MAIYVAILLTLNRYMYKKHFAAGAGQSRGHAPTLTDQSNMYVFLYNLKTHLEKSRKRAWLHTLGSICNSIGRFAFAV